MDSTSSSSESLDPLINQSINQCYIPLCDRHTRSEIVHASCCSSYDDGRCYLCSRFDLSIDFFRDGRFLCARRFSAKMRRSKFRRFNWLPRKSELCGYCSPQLPAAWLTVDPPARQAVSSLAFYDVLIVERVTADTPDVCR